MIPLSKDQKLKYELDGVTYLFHPPIDEIEIELQNHLNKDDSNLKEAKALLPEATKNLEKRFNGNKKPKKKEWNELLEDEIQKLMVAKGIDELNIDEEIEEKRSYVSKILCGWKSKLSIPEFNKDNPCQGLTMPLMNRLYTWYLEQYTLTGEDVKN